MAFYIKQLSSKKNILKSLKKINSLFFDPDPEALLTAATASFFRYHRATEEVNNPKMGGSRCVVCRKTGPRGNFSFPPLTSKPFLLQKWLESLGIDQVPSSTNTRVCYRHFSPDKILQTNSTSATAKAFKLVKGKHHKTCRRLILLLNNS